MYLCEERIFRPTTGSLINPAKKASPCLLFFFFSVTTPTPAVDSPTWKIEVGLFLSSGLLLLFIFLSFFQGQPVLSPASMSMLKTILYTSLLIVIVLSLSLPNSHVVQVVTQPLRHHDVPVDYVKDQEQRGQEDLGRGLQQWGHPLLVRPGQV